MNSSLTATNDPLRVLRPLYTNPFAPFPIIYINWYWSIFLNFYILPFNLVLFIYSYLYNLS